MEQDPRSNIREFIRVIRSDWVALVTGGFSLPLTIGSLLTTGSAQLLFAVGAAGAFIVTAYRAWAGERDKRVSLEEHLAPRLRIEFDPNDPKFVSSTDFAGVSGMLFLRIGARALSPTVSQCKAFLLKISQWDGEKYVTLFDEPLPLPWSYEDPNNVEPMQLNSAVLKFLDVAWFRNPNTRQAPFSFLNHMSGLPNQLRELLRLQILPHPAQNLKVDVLLEGQNSENAEISLNIHRGHTPNDWNKPQLGWMRGNEIRRESNI